MSNTINSVLDKEIIFTPEELLYLSNSYVRLTGVHAIELAEYFTKLLFSERNKKFTLRELTFGDFPNRCKSDWKFKRSGVEWKDQEDIKVRLEKYNPDLYEFIISEIDSFHSKSTSISPFFSECLSKDLFEFDIILITLSNFYCLLTDLCLELSIRFELFDSFESFSEVAQFDPSYGEDIRFYFDLFNKSGKVIFTDIENSFKDVIEPSSQNRKLIERLFLVDYVWEYNDFSFLFLKNHLLRSYINVFGKKHAEWREHLTSLISSYTGILRPKRYAFFDAQNDMGVLHKEKESIARMANYCLRKIEECKQERQKAIELTDEKNTEYHRATESFSLYNPDIYLQAMKDLEHMVKKGEDLDKHPQFRDIYDECILMRINELDALKRYFSLGTFKAPSGFSHFLQNNLRLIGANVDKVFKDKKTYTAFCGVYNRGLMRFFFDFKTLCKNKERFDYYCEQCKGKKGLSILFSIDSNGIPILNLKRIKPEEYLISPFRTLRYEPQRKKENYAIVKTVLFGKKDMIEFTESVDLEVNQVLPVMMFFYWIYISLDSKSEKDVKEINQWIFL